MSTDLVAELCEQGLSAEAAGQDERARAFYAKAWANAEELYDRSIAAHYRTRIVESADERLTWARVSIESALQATEIDDERIYPLLPTLHITAAAAHYENRERDAARDQYLAAACALRVLGVAAPQHALLDGVIFEGLRATGYTMQGACPAVEALIEMLQRDHAIGPLSYVLSSYVAGCGTDEHGADFIVALRELHGSRVLSVAQQHALGSAIEGAQLTLGENEPGSRAPASAAPGSAAPAVAAQSDDPFGDDGPNVALRI